MTDQLVDWTNPCERFAALSKAYYSLVTGGQETEMSIGTEVGPLIGAEKGPPRDADFPHLARRREGVARVELRQVRRRLVG
jgi:hypothetical protein